MARRYRGTIYVDVRADAEVSVDEALEQISDEELLAEVTTRKLEEKVKARVKMADPFALLEEVVDAVRAGDSKEALLLLERIIHPKFGSIELCEKEFKSRLPVATGK